MANGVIDIFERARFLGYCRDGAARVADSFVNYSYPCGDECGTHKAIRMIDGECEACTVIKSSTIEGYTLEGWKATQARWEAEAKVINEK